MDVIYLKKVKFLLLIMFLVISMTACGTKEKKYEVTSVSDVKKTMEESLDNKYTEFDDNESTTTVNSNINDNKESSNIIQQEKDSTDEMTTDMVMVDTEITQPMQPVATEPITEPITTSKPVQAPTVEPTEPVKQCAHTACGNTCTHAHDWQPVYETITVSEAWSEPVYAVRAWYEWIFGHKCLCDVCVNSPYYTKMYNTPSLKYDENGLPTIVEAEFIGNGVDLTAAYNAWLAEDGVGCYGDGSWHDFGTEVGTYGYACNTAFVTMYAYYGETEQLVSYIQHDAVTEMYIDYYYCADNSCGATKEGDK